MLNKRAEGYVSTCIMILVFCIVLALFINFITAINVVRISKRNTYKLLDGYVTQKSIESFNSIKVGNDYTELLDEEAFTNHFCEYNNLQKDGDTLVAKRSDGKEKYRISDLNLSFTKDKSLKLQVEYIITIPISFGGLQLTKATVPLKIKSEFTDKFS